MQVLSGGAPRPPSLTAPERGEDIGEGGSPVSSGRSQAKIRGRFFVDRERECVNVVFASWVSQRAGPRESEVGTVQLKPFVRTTRVSGTWYTKPSKPKKARLRYGETR